MYRIEVNCEWRSEFGGEEGYMYYFIVWNEEDVIVFENDWTYGRPYESDVNRFMEAYFPGVDFIVEGMDN